MAKVTVSFTQKISEAPYETADYSLSIEQEVPDGDAQAVANELFAQIKSEVLSQAGSQYDLTSEGLVMRRLEKSVRPSNGSAPSAPTAPPAGGPTAVSAAVSATTAPAPAPAAPPMGGAGMGGGGRISGRVMPRTDFVVGKDAERRQAAFNILAFHPAKWDNGVEVYKVKERPDGSTDQTPKGTSYPNFSISRDALAMLGFNVDRDLGLWINQGDSNVPLKVWDALGGQTSDQAVEWDWSSRRSELQAFAYQGR